MNLLIVISSKLLFLHEIYVNPIFRLMRFHSMVCLIFIWKMIYLFIRKWLGIATYFCFIFKG